MTPFQEAAAVLHVRSSARAREFYCEKLGFELLFEAAPRDPASPDVYLAVRRGAAVLHLSPYADDGVTGAAVYFTVEDVDALHAELRKRGAPIHLEPTDRSWGMREMYVRDPDGNSLRFGTPR
jgi:catechol 2,3-dioxygenase-like lactoylglutathione lyase family enzyme